MISSNKHRELLYSNGVPRGINGGTSGGVSEWGIRVRVRDNETDPMIKLFP
jgi:hypothetical protein